MKKPTKENLIQDLIDGGYLKTPAIIEAFQEIDRKDFVRDELKEEAYGNYPLPIGFGQTISQPLTVAFMLELLEPQTSEKILDVGSGSGWQTALLAQIVGDQGKIIAIERIGELKKFAEGNISKYNFIEKGIVHPVREKSPQATEVAPAGAAFSNGVKIILSDGSKGSDEDAPFDKIIAGASAEEIPLNWKEQLKIGGRIVSPLGQSIVVLDKKGPNQFKEMQYFGFSFVPLIIDK